MRLSHALYRVRFHGRVAHGKVEVARGPRDDFHGWNQNVVLFGMTFWTEQRSPRLPGKRCAS